MKVPFADLVAQHKEIKQDISRVFKNIQTRSDFILGEDLVSFEKEFAAFCVSLYAVGVSSGTAALFLALKGLDIGPGDEVIIPDFTFIATALAVSYTGAKPVFVDIEEKTYNIDVSKIEKAITKNTKAIIPVHLYGQPADMPEILKIAKKNNLRVIEDACQAHGAAIRMCDGKWVKAGVMGDAGCFSFYPTKNLGALGDGGMITTNNEEFFKKLLMLRDYGRASKYEHSIIGYNSRLDTLQAGILRAKLKRLERWNDLRRSAALLYNKLLGNLDGLIIPFVSEGVKHVYHVYAIRVKNRDEICAKLKEKGIGVLIHYPIPLHLQLAYKEFGYKGGDFPVSERVSAEIMSLPMYPHIKEKQIKFVADALKGAL